jgi:hypothetical protein
VPPVQVKGTAPLRRDPAGLNEFRIFRNDFTIPILTVPLRPFIAPAGPPQIGARTIIDRIHGLFFNHS